VFGGTLSLAANIHVGFLQTDLFAAGLLLVGVMYKIIYFFKLLFEIYFHSKQKRINKCENIIIVYIKRTTIYTQ